jgi:hypothetical protein
MTQLKLIAAAMTLLTLTGCIGFIFPIPGSTSTTTTTTETDRGERR